ncbi:hypothetical protein BCY84_16594 [Trypanosoma cruzi cruzi]|nr:hypothetical protein BCY84_16594 [Trypanosoma cruzi cruzi]
MNLPKGKSDMYGRDAHVPSLRSEYHPLEWIFLLVVMFTATVCDGGGIGFILPVMAMHDASMDMTSALAQTPAVDVDVAASYSNAHSADACASYTSCAECVFDASDGILSPSMDCAWCVSTHRCMRFNVLFLTSNSTPSSSSSSYAAATAKTCPDWRHAKFNANCPDMSCSAAHTTNNIYICRPITIFWILLACILVLLDLGFYMWLHAIRQLPWKYEPRLSQLLTGMPTSTLQPITPVRVNQEQAGSEGREVPTAVDMKEQTSNYHHSNNINNHVDDEKGDPHEHNSQHQQTQKQKRVLRNCPICKMAQPALLSPGHVCFWCDIARFGFIPLFIGTSAAGLSFMLLFCVSLKPWFADGFYAYLLLSAYISYALFGAHVYFRRASRVRVEAARETLYISLAIFLHGRSVLSVMPSLSEGEIVPSASASTSAQASPLQRPVQPAEGGVGGKALLQSNGLTTERIRQKKGETAQLLNMEDLEHGIRKVLRQTLNRDECVLWCEKPEVSSVILYDLWLYLDLLAGLALGIWLFVASSVKDSSYVLVRLVGSTSMCVIGFVLILVFACLLMTTLSSSTRLYVLTDNRLLTIFNGFISPTVTETELRSLRRASIYGCKMWTAKPELTFSWEVPVTERKLPPIKSQNFPCVIHLEEFLKYFKMVAPKFMPINDQIRKGIRHERKAWRLYLFFCIVLLHFLPIITFYPLFVPGFLSLLLLIIFGVVVLATVHRGVRAQHVTHTPLNLVDHWAPCDPRRSRRGSGGRASPLARLVADGNSTAENLGSRPKTVTFSSGLELPRSRESRTSSPPPPTRDRPK